MAEPELSQAGTLDKIHPTIAAYAEVLMAAGFTVYAPPATRRDALNFLHYSQVVDGKVCFGTVSMDWFDSFVHSMPVKPSREHGSAIILSKEIDPWSIEAAIRHAQPRNPGAFIGGVVKENHKPWGIGERYFPVSQVGTEV